MKIWYIERNDSVGYYEYNSAVVVAESPDKALQLLIDKNGQEEYNGWGKYDVKIVEIIPNVAKIWIESYNAG